LADRIVDKIHDKLEQNDSRLGELSFSLAVALDKRAHIDGRNQISASNVSIQVNNFNGAGLTREQLLKSLNGEPIDVSPPPDNPPPT
jgi:hypothetical protein